ncbi:hypothetical protein [Parafrankia sp. EUN1f]|uniref:hypothetical protein n=1 Tax=Parafrankia sp. EUN1f TaxID=102897 RepID=UPI0001C45AEC|nr:hypothetical protein [Parafrankia sp. EUN1f]EFC81917.1 hypothetical protein FrEUN1fDRAFT_4990 [Parafrankia sp. EUN1f]
MAQLDYVAQNWGDADWKITREQMPTNSSTAGPACWSVPAAEPPTAQEVLGLGQEQGGS